MSTLDNFFSPVLTRALGWTLLHSLWQGALLAAVLGGALLLLRRHRAELRYLASALALGGTVLAAGLTFGRYYFVSAPAPLAAVAWNGEPAAAVAKPGPTITNTLYRPRQAAAKVVVVKADTMPTWLTTTLRYFEQNLPLLVTLWLLGLLAMSLRMVGGLLYVQRLKRYRVRPLGVAWQARLAALAERGGLKRPVQLLESALVQVPLVVGHVRPVILLPLGAVAGLSPNCLEAILAHELAHVLRRDYLVNLLQTVAEALFFYHPAVWFMGNCLRAERENCCDDTATVLVGGDPLRLARALTALAEWSQSAVIPTAPRLALAAVGGRGSLLGRVRRLVQRRPAAPTWGEGLMAAVLVLAGLGLLGGSAVLAGPAAQRLNLLNAGKKGAPADTTKRLSNTVSTSNTTSASTTTVDGLVVAAVKDGMTLTDAELAELRAEMPAMPVVESAADNGAATEANDDQDPPRKRKQRQVIVQRGPRPAPGTVVIEKDKKGRVTNLTVNGQPVDHGKNAKGGKKSKNAPQVTVLTVPPAPVARRGFNFDFDFSGFDEKTERKLEKAGKKLEKWQRSFVYVTPETGAHRVHVDVDGDVIASIADDAVAVGSMSLNLGLQAAAQGLAEARRGLREALRNPDLGERERREIERSLQDLDRTADEDARVRKQDARVREQDARIRKQDARVREQDARMRAEGARIRAEGARVRAEDAREQVLEAARERAEDEADAARDRAEELRERRREIQREQQELQRELQELEAETRTMPAPPRAPRAPRAPQAPRVGQAPVAPTPPAPPAQPRDNSGKIRDALRADGLIGKNDKDFQFELSAAGMTVNGKKQPAATAEKYRKLLGQSKDSKGSKSRTTINFSERD